VTFAQYFRAALFLPLICGVLSFWSPKLDFLAIGLLYYGPRYIVFAILVLLWSRGREEKILRKATWILPIVFVPFMLISIPDTHGPRPPFEWQTFITEVGKISLLTLVVGYVYVLIAWGLYLFIKSVRARKHA
jgi:hypothetical protein